MKKNRSCILVASMIAGAAIFSAAPAAFAVEFPAGTVVPVHEFIGFGQAVTIAQNAGADLITRVQIERENGRWVYKVESYHVRDRRRIRQDIDARTGQVRRMERKTMGGGDTRDMNAFVRARPSVTVTFPAAAAISANAVPNQPLVSVRLERNDNTVVYKTEHWVNNTSEAQVRINASTGAVIQVQGAPANPNPNPSPNPSPNPGPTPIPTPPPQQTPNLGTLNGNARRLANAALQAANGLPAGSLVMEIKVRTQRFVGSVIETETVVAGGGTKVENTYRFGNGQLVESETEGAGEKGATFTAVTAALDGRSPIGYTRAMEIALGVRPGDINAVELEMLGNRPIYEVKVLGGGRERSIKIHAATGAVLSS